MNHLVAICIKCSNSASLLPSGATLTPKFHLPLSLVVVGWVTICSGIVYHQGNRFIQAGIPPELKIHQIPEAFSGTSTPLVANNSASHSATAACMWVATASAKSAKSVNIKSVSSMKASPASFLLCLEIASMSRAKNPSSCRISNRGKLMAAQICGLSPFLCLMPAIGAPHFCHPLKMPSCQRPYA